MKSHQNKKVVLSEKSLSFRGSSDGVVSEMFPRPRTVPDLLHAGIRSAVEEIARPQKLTKMLLHVTIPKTPVAVRVLLPPEATVEDLIAAALRQYVKEERRPVLPSAVASGFDLHYSSFSLESLDRSEKLMELGSRNFFLCPKSETTATSKEADNVAINNDLSWLRFMSFLH